MDRTDLAFGTNPNRKKYPEMEKQATGPGSYKIPDFFSDKVFGSSTLSKGFTLGSLDYTNKHILHKKLEEMAYFQKKMEKNALKKLKSKIREREESNFDTDYNSSASDVEDAEKNYQF